MATLFHNCSLLSFVPLKAPEGQVHRGCGTAHRNVEIETESCVRVGPALKINAPINCMPHYYVNGEGWGLSGV